jgi:hypothetical protein
LADVAELPGQFQHADFVADDLLVLNRPGFAGGSNS